jgi:hypothetical protein
MIIPQNNAFWEIIRGEFLNFEFQNNTLAIHNAKV